MGMNIFGAPTAPGDRPLPPLPNPGIDGWSHYWHAQRLAGNPGDVETGWPDAGATPDNLVRVVVDPGSGVPEPVLMQENGIKFARIAGKDLQGSTAVLSPRSFAILLRHPPALGMSVARIAGCGISRSTGGTGHADGSGVYRINPGGALGSIAAGNATAVSTWMFICGTIDPAGPTFAFQGVDAATAGAFTPPSSTALTATQHPVVSTTASTPAAGGTYYVDVVYHVVWPFLASLDQRLSMYAACKVMNPTAGLP